MAKFKGGTTVTDSLEVSGNIVDISGDVGTSGQFLTALGPGENQSKITASDGAADDEFGFSVAVGSNKIVVGAQGDDSIKGSVYVYDLDGSNQTKITASDGAANDQFGFSVAVGSNKIVVSARGDDSSKGSAYVYDLDGSNEVKITASDGAAGDNFGNRVAVASDKIVVGATGVDSFTGAVYVYDLDGSNQTKITASDGAAGDLFGRSVAAGHSKIVVGSSKVEGDATDSGSVYVYDLDGSNQTKITASDGAAGDMFGFSVAVGSDKIVVGARDDHNDNGDDAGAVYVYDLDGSNEVKIIASDGAADDEFGFSVAVENDKIVVGAMRDNDNGTNSGSVYVYNMLGRNEVKFIASDGAATDNFGRSVAAGNSKIVVGANDAVVSSLQTGAVYVHDLYGTNWKTIGITTSTGITNYIKCVCASATNLETSGSFSTLSWMNTTPSFSNGFSAPTATTITVPNDGLYLIGLNLDLNQTNTDDINRYNHGFEIVRNSGLTSNEIRNNYIRGEANSCNHFNSSANAMKILTLDANDTISIKNRRLAGGTDNTLQLTTNSSIFVVQIA